MIEVKNIDMESSPTLMNEVILRQNFAMFAGTPVGVSKKCINLYPKQDDGTPTSNMWIIDLSLAFDSREWSPPSILAALNNGVIALRRDLGRPSLSAFMRTKNRFFTNQTTMLAAVRQIPPTSAPTSKSETDVSKFVLTAPMYVGLVAGAIFLIVFTVFMKRRRSASKNKIVIQPNWSTMFAAANSSDMFQESEMNADIYGDATYNLSEEDQAFEEAALDEETSWAEENVRIPQNNYIDLFLPSDADKHNNYLDMSNDIISKTNTNALEVEHKKLKVMQVNSTEYKIAAESSENSDYLNVFGSLGGEEKLAFFGCNNVM